MAKISKILLFALLVTVLLAIPSCSALERIDNKIFYGKGIDVEGGILADNITTDNLTVTNAVVTDLEADTITSDEITTENITATEGHFADLYADSANFTLESGYDPASLSVENKTIYVDKEATGAADGTSWTDAFTTIQDAVDSCPDAIAHQYTIYVRDGTKKLGTADGYVENHLQDDTSANFTAADVGKRVFNVTDGAWGVIGAFNDAGDVSIVDTAGNNYDLFDNGNEAYVIEPAPYRETVYLNSAPDSHRSHAVWGRINIYAEYYWQDACDANSVNGTILDASADFTAVEVGDAVWVWDRNGANNRSQYAERGYVTSVSDAASGNITTTITATPSSNWYYCIVKTEISGSDDGTTGGISRGTMFHCIGIDNIYIHGFLTTLHSVYAVRAESSNYIYYWYSIILGEYGALSGDNANLSFQYNYMDDMTFSIVCAANSYVYAYYWAQKDITYGVYNYRLATCILAYTYSENADRAFWAKDSSVTTLTYSTIDNNSNIGLYARGNSYIGTNLITNNAVTAEDPAGTTEGTFID